MKFVALITAAIAIPFAAALGYVANPDPAPATIKQAVERDLKPRAGSDYEEWLYVATKGPRAGEVVEALYVVAWSKKDLRDAGVQAGRYVVRDCALYTTTGDPAFAADATVVNYCTQRRVSKKKVLEHLRSEAQNGVGSPALIG